MRLLFIFNDSPRGCLEAQYTNVFPAISRRTVEVELTPEQAEQIERKQQGVDCGRPVYEQLESITLVDVEEGLREKLEDLPGGKP